MSEQLTKAREYEENAGKQVPKEERQLFHVTPTVGWMNDPNGFSRYQGEYHLFYQYHPYDTKWGPMHWGHVKTNDFIRWERLPIALAPDTEADKTGCFSGSALETEDGQMLLAYTGVTTVEEDGQAVDYQQQCIAIGDGINFEKISCNPILDRNAIPKENHKQDFRDPKIWAHKDCYYMAVANRSADTSGEILLYKCKKENIHDWSYVGVLDKCNNEYGKMWECPDYFALDGYHVLLVSPQEMKASQTEFHCGYNAIAFLGGGDNQGNFCRRTAQTLDYGMDYYAPQTVQTDDGRRILIAWMQNWETANYNNEEHHIYGSMTVPRELTVENARILQKPVREITNYYGKETRFEKQIVNGNIEIGMQGRVFDMTICLSNYKDCNRFRINLAASRNMECYSQIRYDFKNHEVTIDRSHCGCRRDMVHVRTFPVEAQDVVKLRILMDKNSIELFVNDGKASATMLIDTPISMDAITFEADGNITMEAVHYDLEEKLCENK